MPREARVKSRTGIYHIMWRGANRQEIFHEDEDWMNFLTIFKRYKLKCELKVYAWCLMSNHVHLLMKEGNEDISKTMQRIGVSYAGNYNWKYRTTGHLFQDRFKSENVENKEYLRTVVRYIHQNPVKAGMVQQADEWKWSSCRGYYGENLYPKDILDGDVILGMFSADKAEAMEKFKEYNEKKSNDKCLDDWVGVRRLTDGEAREEMKRLLGEIEIAQVKSLPKEKRNEILRTVKEIQGLSLRQAARIFGIPLSLVFKA
jgi:REP element-mobilizing transposase RayT